MKESLKTITLAFDVYGTLINTDGVVSQLEGFMGSKAAQFSRTWRDKQLEYSFRKALMNQYQDFSTCTEQALDYTSQFYQVELTEVQRNKLLDIYKFLPIFDDVKEALEELTDSGVDQFAFSNGEEKTIKELLRTADILDYFKGVVSADTIKSFKPNPSVYKYFLTQSKAERESTWLVSSNPFDILGASSCGFSTAWIRRNEQIPFDPWGVSPTITLNSLSHIYERTYAGSML